jgi:hypothetical protein
MAVQMNSHFFILIRFSTHHKAYQVTQQSRNLKTWNNQDYSGLKQPELKVPY